MRLDERDRPPFDQLGQARRDAIQVLGTPEQPGGVPGRLDQLAELPQQAGCLPRGRELQHLRERRVPDAGDDPDGTGSGPFAIRPSEVSWWTTAPAAPPAARATPRSSNCTVATSSSRSGRSKPRTADPTARSVAATSVQPDGDK